MRNSFFFALQYPFARSKGSLGGIHARTSLRALHHVCREHKKDPHTPHKKSEDLVTNMMSLNMITNRPEEAATPSGAVNRGARRKQAGLQAASASEPVDTYGVTEAELRGLLVACRFISVDAVAGSEDSSTTRLAEQFRLKPEDVALLARYNASVVSKPSSELGGQPVALRPF